MKKAAFAVALLLLASSALANPSGWITVFVPLNPATLTNGANGAKWVTQLWVSNTSDREFPVVCDSRIFEPPQPPCGTLPAHSSTRIISPDFLQHPGWFFNVLSSFVNPVPPDALNFTLRTSNEATPQVAATEVPVVTPDAFRNSLALPHVQLNGQSRLRLRVYGLDNGVANVRAVGLTTKTEVWSTTLQMKGLDQNAPSYAEVDVLSSFVTADTALRIEVTSDVKVWAFVSITDNVTQQFTIVSPAQGVYVPKSTA